MNKTSKAAKEEVQATLELRECTENQYRDSHQTYAQRLVDINYAYNTLVREYKKRRQYHGT